MKLGDLVMSTLGERHIYENIVGNHRIFVGTFGKKSIGVSLDLGFSDTDVPYLKVFVNGLVGWVRLEGLNLVSHK